MLHGRGSTGPEFAEDLFSSSTANNTTKDKDKNLPASLPTWRWVFPTSKERWDSRFEEDLSAWFEAYSLADIEEKEELQVEGLKDPGAYILGVLEEEVRGVGGDAGRVFLGGISQGMAMGLWAFFLYVVNSKMKKALGGVLGFCGWLPFGRVVEEVLGGGGGEVRRVVSAVLGDAAVSDHGKETGDYDDDAAILRSTPVFLSHGTDDAFVSVDLGREATRVLQQAGIAVEWYEFVGAENDGHWVKEPEGFDQIVRFLESHSG